MARTFEFVLHIVGCVTVTVSPNQIIIIIIFNKDVGVTRGQFQAFKKRVIIDVGRYKFGNRACIRVELVNTMCMVSAGSLNTTFKAKLDHHLRKVSGLV